MPLAGWTGSKDISFAVKQLTHANTMTTLQPHGTERDAVKAAYDHDPVTGRITQLGKFEGTPIFAPYYWDLALQGFADADNGAAFTFKFKNEDADFALWPELKVWLGRKRTMWLCEDSQGFVHCY